MKYVGVVLLFVGMSAVAMALEPVVPEIDAGSAGSAIALLAGAVMLVRSRRKN
jgi:hypothetical protein